MGIGIAGETVSNVATVVARVQGVPLGLQVFEVRVIACCFSCVVDVEVLANIVSSTI
jgi:hypothetical protein